MKKICLIIGILLSVQLNAQRTTTNVVDELKMDTKIVNYEMDTSRKTASSILFDYHNSYSVENTESLLKKYFGLRSDIDQLIKGAPTDMNDNISVTRYHQSFMGVPVEFGSVVVTSHDKQLSSITGEFYNVNNKTVITSSIKEADALTKALQFINAKKYMWEDNTNSDLGLSKYPVGEKVLLELKNEDAA